MSRPTALVTGPTAGIGTRFAEQLAARGHDLVLVARDEPRLRALATRLEREYGATVEVLVTDLADRSATARVEARLADLERPVDLLVNNAGFGHQRPFLDTSVEDEQRMLDVLVTAPLRLTHAALEAMVARGRGSIVNVSSIAGFLPRGTYGAAKAYVTSLSRWADLTYRERGVRVMAVCPGLTRTEFHDRMGLDRVPAPGWMWLDPDRVVTEALRDLERGRRVSVPTRRYRMMTGVVRCTPVGVLGRLPALRRR